MGRLTLLVGTLTVLVIGCAPQRAPRPQPETTGPAPTTAPTHGLPSHGLGTTEDSGRLPDPAGAATTPAAPSFFGIVCDKETAAYDVVYLIDRSGSMLDLFDDARAEMLRSINRLGKGCRFHVIFYAEGTPKENPPGRLVVASEANRLALTKYIWPIQPWGRSHVIPALKRAFEVLKDERKGNEKAGKFIFLLTDGEFSDGNQKVIETAKSLNPDKIVVVNTVLFVDKSPAAEKVLTEIAEDSGGQFKFVPADE